MLLMIVVHLFVTMRFDFSHCTWQILPGIRLLDLLKYALHYVSFTLGGKPPKTAYDTSIVKAGSKMRLPLPMTDSAVNTRRWVGFILQPEKKSVCRLIRIIQGWIKQNWNSATRSLLGQSAEPIGYSDTSYSDKSPTVTVLTIPQLCIC